MTLAAKPQDAYINTGEIVADWTTTTTYEPPLLDLFPRAIERYAVTYTGRLVSDPAETARILASPAAKVLLGEPKPPKGERRPWFYRGRYRWTRSRAALFAATWPGGAR